MMQNPPPGSHHHHSVADNAFAAMGWASLLRGMGAGSWRHPLRDLAIAASSLVIAPGVLLVLAELGWPDSGWNLLIGVGIFIWINTIPTKLDRKEDARWLRQNIAVETTYRATYTSKLATVCTPDELRHLAGLWDVPERSYEDDAFWAALADRWFEANPARYPSQDQARATGLLCSCDPSRGHTCLRLSRTPNVRLAESALMQVGTNGRKAKSRTTHHGVTLPTAGKSASHAYWAAQMSGRRASARPPTDRD